MTSAAAQWDTLGAGAAVQPALKIEARPHLELEVTSKDRSTDFYRALFGRQPSQNEEGRARFDLDEPYLTLFLDEDAAAVARDGHLGIQVKYTQDVKDIRLRLEAAGYKIDVEEAEASCCFSVANKVWVSDPDRNLWEIYVLLESNTSDVRCGSSCACEASGCG